MAENNNLNAGETHVREFFLARRVHTIFIDVEIHDLTTKIKKSEKKKEEEEENNEMYKANYIILYGNRDVMILLEIRETLKKE